MFRADRTLRRAALAAALAASSTLTLLAAPADAQESACASGACAREVAEGWIEGPEGPVYAHYERIDGAAVLEGDVRVRELGRSGRAAIGTGPIRTWPGGVIPYVIGGGIADPATLLAAIDHVNANTVLELVPRSGEADHLEFLAGGGCWSYVGRQGGRQEISVAGCPLGSTVHEILHAAGVWHEQSRSDRDAHVVIQYANVDPSYVSNFDTFPAGQGQDHGAYDYGSIMHYPATAFSVNGQPTIVPLQPAAPIGQRAALSTGDVAGLAALYGAAPTPTPAPAPGPGTMAPVASTKLKVKQDAGDAARARLALRAVDATLAPPAAGDATDPAVGGARLRLVNPATGEQGVVELPAAGWARTPKGALRFVGGGCKVSLKPTGKLSVACQGTTGGFSLDEPFQGVLGLKLELAAGSGFCAGGGLVRRDYGVGFGGSPTRGSFVSTDGPRPTGCGF